MMICNYTIFLPFSKLVIRKLDEICGLAESINDGLFKKELIIDIDEDLSATAKEDLKRILSSDHFKSLDLHFNHSFLTFNPVPDDLLDSLKTMS